MLASILGTICHEEKTRVLVGLLTFSKTPRGS